MGASGLAEISTDWSASKIQKGLSDAQAKCLKSFRQKSARLLCLHRELIRQCKDNNNYLNNKDMTEELRNKLTERFEQLSSSIDCDEQVKDALFKAYLAGGEYGYEIGIDEAKDFMSKCIWGRCADKFHATKED